jgi:hypothetical protein
MDHHHVCFLKENFTKVIIIAIPATIIQIIRIFCSCGESALRAVCIYHANPSAERRLFTEIFDIPVLEAGFYNGIAVIKGTCCIFSTPTTVLTQVCPSVIFCFG